MEGDELFKISRTLIDPATAPWIGSIAPAPPYLQALTSSRSCQPWPAREELATNAPPPAASCVNAPNSRPGLSRRERGPGESNIVEAATAASTSKEAGGTTLKPRPALENDAWTTLTLEARKTSCCGSSWKSSATGSARGFFGVCFQ